MARTSKGGGGALATAIVFGLLWLITGALAITFYTQLNKSKQTERSAVARANDVGSQADIDRAQALLPPPESGGSSGGTVLRQLIDELNAAKLVLAANPEKPASAIRQTLEADGLLADENVELFVQRVRAEERSDKTEVANLQEAVATLQGKLDAMVKQNEALLAKTTDAISQINSNYQSRQEQFNAYQQQKDASVDTLNAQLVSVRDATRKEVAELNRVNEGLRTTIIELQNRIDDLTKPSSRSSTSEVRPELLPDGNVVSIQEKEDMVYINRGRKDRVTPGLTFEVFDRLGGIRVDENGELRGKATIEVVNITNDNASIGRIVRRTANTTLVEGDLIANAVYDPNMVLSFHVVGEFDLDNTGNPSRGDRRRVESMIEQWGGKVVNELTYNTDFLVLGPQPELPEPLDADEIDTQKIREYEEAKVRYETYQSLLLRAKELRIPVLNQNRFLVLVGYYRR